MSNKPKKKKQVRNKARDAIGDYYKTGREYDKDNRQRQKEEGASTKGLKNLNAMEKTCVAVIVLGLVGIVIKYVIL
ncbi:MAG: hypothetical protein GX663_07070 [Clostridiales bacterium]|nr:hypothetical protein [Clostridiales bacterium]